MDKKQLIVFYLSEAKKAVHKTASTFLISIKISACGSVVEHVPDKNGVEGSIPSTRIFNIIL